MITNPLLWPDEWPRTELRKWSNFNVTTAQAVKHLAEEVRRMGGRELLITTDQPATKTGHAFMANAKAPADPGVAIYFAVGGRELCLPCDQWRTVGDNIRALGKTVEALRGIERWGSRGLFEKAYEGFAALPAATTALAVPWWDVLGVSASASPVEVIAAYKRALRAAHPDAGGSHERFLAVQAAYEMAPKERAA